MGIYEELEWRGLIKDVSDPSIKDKLNAGGLTFYIGTDPTGDSLHIGHFSSFLICKRLKDAGHHPIVLVGGATGLIGDPKPDSERPMITKEAVEHNFNCLKSQLSNLFGCEVVNNDSRKKIINRIKKFTSEKSLILAIIGVIGLAISVNFIEFACSAGWPVIFTNILEMNELSGIENFIYILIYIIFFLIDDIIIFTIAMFTFNIKAISNKYSKYSHLIGGILMLIIGLLMIFAPNILMFNF